MASPEKGQTLRYRGRDLKVTRLDGDGAQVVATNPENGRSVTMNATDLLQDAEGVWIHSRLSDEEIERWRKLAGAGRAARPKDHVAARRLLMAAAAVEEV